MPANKQSSPSFFNFNTPQSFEAAKAASRVPQSAPSPSNPANGTREAPGTQKKDQQTDAPANAPAANKGNTQSVYSGLCEALNAHQQDLVKRGTYQFPDVYEVVFAPTAMGASSLKKQGSVDKKVTPTVQAKDPKAQLDPETNKVDTAGVIVQVTSGMQIVQFLEEYIRNSTYITDQQLYVIDPNTQKVIPSGASPTGQVAWYKISVSAVPYGSQKDEKRNDFPYKITYLITPYAVNEMQSQWFPKTNFRGVHKSYKYWFTGENTSVIGFEQEYNALWSLALSGTLPAEQDNITDSRLLSRKTWQTGSDASTQGPASGKVNEPAANAANYLYDAADQSQVKLQIVGDPAWLQQGEVGPGVSATTFTFSPFLPDGTINFDSQSVVFDISWNRPVDYNMNTGLMDVTENNVPPDVMGGGTGTQPQQNYTYQAISCRSTFAKGRFTQELTGSIYTQLKDNSPNQASSGREKNAGITAGDLGYRDSKISVSDILNPNKWDSEPDTSRTSPTSSTSNEPASDSGSNPQPANPPQAPTSGGPIESAGNEAYQATLNASLRAGDITVDQARQLGLDANTTPPQVMAPPDDGFYR